MQLQGLDAFVEKYQRYFHIKIIELIYYKEPRSLNLVKKWYRTHQMGSWPAFFRRTTEHGIRKNQDDPPE